MSCDNDDWFDYWFEYQFLNRQLSFCQLNANMRNICKAKTRTIGSSISSRPIIVFLQKICSYAQESNITVLPKPNRVY